MGTENSPGDEVALGDGPDHGGNLKVIPPPVVGAALLGVQSGLAGVLLRRTSGEPQNLGVDVGRGEGGVAGSGSNLGYHTGQEGDLMCTHTFHLRHFVSLAL